MALDNPRACVLAEKCIASFLERIVASRVGDSRQISKTIIIDPMAMWSVKSKTEGWGARTKWELNCKSREFQNVFEGFKIIPKEQDFDCPRRKKTRFPGSSF